MSEEVEQGFPTPPEYTSPLIKSLAADRSSVNETITETGRKRPPEFWPKLHHKAITVKIAGAPSVSGTLEGYSTYEVVVRSASGRETLIPKHAITGVDLPADWRRRAPDAETGSGEAT